MVSKFVRRVLSRIWGDRGLGSSQVDPPSAEPLVDPEDFQKFLNDMFFMAWWSYISDPNRPREPWEQALDTYDEAMKDYDEVWDEVYEHIREVESLGYPTSWTDDKISIH